MVPSFPERADRLIHKTEVVQSFWALVIAV
jgi:hypothetical protein